MGLVTTSFERGLHLLLFVSGGVGFAVAALAVLERLSDGTKRTIRVVHVAVAIGGFSFFFIAERVYHTLH